MVTITFADYGAKTKFTFQQTPFKTLEDRDSHEEGWSQSFERLAAHIAEL
ncbi:MAG: SRPBCC domain-containing protein [Terriglobia bacterium]